MTTNNEISAENMKLLEETISEANGDGAWKELGRLLGEQVKEDMDRHMLSPVAERIKAGIRADVEARKSVEGKDD